MKYFLTLICFVLLSSINLDAQNNYFHRLYPSNTRDQRCISMHPNSNGFYVLNAIQMDNEMIGVNIVSLDLKGDENWSKDINYGDNIFVEDGKLILLDKDTIAIAITLADETGVGHTNIITKVDPTGEELWSRITGGLEGVTNQDTILTTISPKYDFSIAHFSSLVYGDNDRRLHSMNVDTEGNVNWSKVVTITNQEQNTIAPEVSDSDVHPDSSFMVTGNALDQNLMEQLLVKIDTLGDPVWGRNYYNDTIAFEAVNISVGLDSTTVLGGTSSRIDNPTSMNGFVSYVDTLGALLWSKEIIFDGSGTTSVSGVEVLNSGDIMVAGAHVDLIGMDNFNFLIRFDKLGTVKWQRAYNKLDAVPSPNGELYELMEDDAAIAAFSSRSLAGRLSFQLLSVDSLGASMCEDTISENIIFDLSLQTDTLSFDTVSDTLVMEFEAVTETALPLDIPVLILVDTMFCPNDPIFVIEDARTEGAISYLWNTEETTDTIIVEEEGNPSVIVTMDHDLGCYILCDSAMVSYLDTVMTSIVLNTEDYCEDRTVRLASALTPGLAPYEIIWSTMEEDFSITVTPPGTYAVSVTDACDILATAEITVDENNLPQPDPIGISFNSDLYCETEQFQLTASGSSDAYTSFGWTDMSGNVVGSNAAVIFVPDFGTYNVTALDDCNFEVSATITISEDNLRTANLGIVQTDSLLCELGILTLETTLSGNDVKPEFLSDIVWSTGAMTNAIDITEFGPYTVTAEYCNQPITAQIQASPDINNLVAWPNVFVPQGGEEVDEDNKSFRPYVECPESVTAYELRVYSRWGQEIFQTNDVLEAWTGTDDGNNAPADAYVYYSSYTISGVSSQVNGTVTLLR